MNIVQAIRDPNLFRPYLADESGSITTWARWMCCLRVIYGLPLTKKWQRRLVRQCTGRDPDLLPKDGFRNVLLLCGRRSGKSKIGGLIAGFEAALSGREKLCSPGELPMVSIVSPTKDQSQIIKSYTRAALSSELLDNEITDDNRDLFKLGNGVTVRILTGGYRHVRSFTQLCVLVDEVCFFGSTEESAVKSDTELIRSVKPSLLTTKGRLVCISTKYRPSGWAHSTWKKHFGSDTSTVLVWDAASRVMNPTLSQEDIDAELAEDLESARAEFLNLWREDVSSWLPREAIMPCVVRNRKELLPQSGIAYCGFVDVSGGRSDSAALAIGHKDKTTGTIILDLVREYRAPFSPADIIDRMSQTLVNYRIRSVTGDNYSAEFAVQEFKRCGIGYRKSEKNKSTLYLELLPRICSGGVALLDDETLINQLCGLERRCRSGGRDSVDHGHGAKDDVANAAAGVVDCVAKPVKRCGTWGDAGGWGSNPRERLLRELIANNARVNVLE